MSQPASDGNDKSKRGTRMLLYEPQLDRKVEVEHVPDPSESVSPKPGVRLLLELRGHKLNKAGQVLGGEQSLRRGREGGGEGTKRPDGKPMSAVASSWTSAYARYGGRQTKRCCFSSMDSSVPAVYCKREKGGRSDQRLGPDANREGEQRPSSTARDELRAPNGRTAGSSCPGRRPSSSASSASSWGTFDIERHG